MEENNTKSKRVFIAIDFSDEVVKELARLGELISNWPFTGKRTELENLHLTLKFLGEVEEEKLEKIKEVLRKIEFRKLEVSLGNIGCFCWRGQPRIVWIKINSKELHNLQREIEKAMKEFGFEAEEEFKAHVTLARIKYVKDKEGFRAHLRSIKPRELKFNIDKFSLKSSVLDRIGPVYSDLEIFCARES